MAGQGVQRGRGSGSGGVWGHGRGEREKGEKRVERNQMEDDGDTTVCIMFRYGGLWKMVKGTNKRTYRSPMIEIFITVEHNISSYIVPTIEEDCTEEDCGDGLPQSFSFFYSDAKDDKVEQMHKFSVVFEDEEDFGGDEEPKTMQGRAHNVTIEEIGPVNPNQRECTPNIPVGKDDRQDPSNVEADKVSSESSYHEIYSSVTDNCVSKYEEAFDVQDEEDPDIRIGVKFENIEALRVWRAKCKGSSMIWGSYDDLYALVSAMRHELLKRNSNSVIHYTIDVDHSFERLFVAFGGFLTGCRPFIGLDGYHLKNCLHEAIKDVDGLVFMSDRGKGLDDAVKQTFSCAEHRACVRHLYKNLKRKYPGEFLERLVWSAARSYTVQRYTEYMRQIEEVSKEAYNYLMSEKDHCWCRAMFGTTAKCSHLTNNLGESFIAFIGDASSKPIIHYVDAIRVKIMSMMNKRRVVVERWKGFLVPKRSSIDRAKVNGPKGRWKIIPSERYKATYSLPIFSLPNKFMWESQDLRFTAKPPRCISPPGRPRKKRIKPHDEESRSTKVRRIHRCGRCGGLGHH
ncbi:hypothetical protein QJS10_CPB04g01220 [Acorus calamus]|uniref:MULE transposase domain-containing protein n=1 Tax=Acorus calamus TaxID=4465 RepID=A0AAV9F0L6_ACOCL|nr:hypothetical protein QJS10_CPB04g01220 [Acorus calamus]